MKLSDKIYVAGHAGLLGSALVRRLRQAGYDNLLLKTHSELDLTDAGAVRCSSRRCSRCRTGQVQSAGGSTSASG